jgi:uncharacterized protein YidB (DUF937 family)
MTMIDDLMKKAGGGDAAKVAQKVGPLLEQVGGVDGLVKKFESAGLGGVAKSWISTGSNEPVSPGQVKEALGQQQLEQVANEANVSPDQAAEGLSKVLPEAVDNLTPNAEVPAPETVQARLGS